MLRDYVRSQRLRDKANPNTESREHADRGIGAEQIDASSQQIADSWLRDSEQFGDLSLRETSRGNQRLQLDQQIGANRQVRRLFTREANVPKNVAARSYDHDAPFSHDGVDAFRWLFRRL